MVKVGRRNETDWSWSRSRSSEYFPSGTTGNIKIEKNDFLLREFTGYWVRTSPTAVFSLTVATALGIEHHHCRIPLYTCML